MEYKHFQLEDFLTDEFFVSWVHNPDPSSDHFWENWLKQHPDKVLLIREARTIVQSVGYKHQYRPEAGDYLEVLEKIHQKKHSKLHHQYKHQNRRWLGMAAAVLLLLVGSYLVYEFQPEASPVVAEEPEKPLIREVPFGQKLTVTLPDGSIIKLNSGTTFWYNPQEYGRSQRDVFLKGEAFFDVKRDKTRPFRVFSKEVVTQVLGTTFNIRAYEQDDQVRIAVASGKVSTYSDSRADQSQAEVFRPGELSLFNLEGGSHTRLSFDPVEEYGWKDDALVIKDQTFEDVVQSLEKWYGATFIIDQHVSVDGKFSGTFRDESLENVIKGLGFLSKMNVTQKQDTVWIQPD
ncbi:MAG: FecR domain-containing protein [Bacteroidota bacterium]